MDPDGAALLTKHPLQLAAGECLGLGAEGPDDLTGLIFEIPAASALFS